MKLSREEKERIFEENKKIIPYVYSFKLIKSPVQAGIYQDLFQEGYIALWQSIDSYDERDNVKFSSYATTCVLYAMVRYLRRNNPIFQTAAELNAPVMTDDNEKISVIDSITYDDPEYFYDIREDILKGYYNYLKQRYSYLKFSNFIERRTKMARTVIYRLYEGYSIADIAKELGISKPTVYEILTSIKRSIIKIENIRG